MTKFLAYEVFYTLVAEMFAGEVGSGRSSLVLVRVPSRAPEQLILLESVDSSVRGTVAEPSRAFTGLLEDTFMDCLSRQVPSPIDGDQRRSVLASTRVREGTLASTIGEIIAPLNGLADLNFNAAGPSIRDGTLLLAIASNNLRRLVLCADAVDLGGEVIAQLMRQVLEQLSVGAGDDAEARRSSR